MYFFQETGHDWDLPKENKKNTDLHGDASSNDQSKTTKYREEQIFETTVNPKIEKKSTGSYLLKDHTGVLVLCGFWFWEKVVYTCLYYKNYSYVIFLSQKTN